MNPWRAILAAVVIFCAGAVTGGLATRLWLFPARSQTAPPSGPPDFGANQRLRFSLGRLDQQLKLTDDQRAKAEKILRESQERMWKLWQGISPQAKDDFRQTQQAIHAILTAEQQKLFDELCTKRRGHPKGEGPTGWNGSREHRRGPGFGRPPGGGPPSVLQAPTNSGSNTNP